MSPTPGALVMSALVPILKIALATLAGFVIAKQGFFPAAASKGFSYIVMNLTLPCLIFASIVPSFNSSNISAIGPLAMMAFFYEGAGLVMALLVREIFWVPKHFQMGILIMGTFSNWANLPTSVVQSLAIGDPFDPVKDPDLGVGFVAVFILIYNITFFTGASKLCGWDFKDPTEEGRREGFLEKWRRRRRWLDGKLGRETETRRTLTNGDGGAEELGLAELERSPLKGEKTQGDATTTTDLKTDLTSPTFLSPPLCTSTLISPSKSRMSARQAMVVGARSALSCLLTPITLSLLVALVVALVSPLKALFVPDVEGWSGTRVKLAPDGRPALAFIQETAVFIGAICVPGALILLGASFARLKVPRNWSTLPAITATKMLILPVIGVGFVQGLSSSTTLFPKEDRMLSFVAMFLSGSPAAVLQLVVTQLVAPDEASTDVLAAFLLAQYLFLFFSSTALTVVSLKFVS